MGVITCEKLKLSPKGSPAPKAVTIKYAVDEDLDREAGTITQGDIGFGKVCCPPHGRISDPG